MSFTSIIVLNYNTKAVTAKCIDAVIRYTQEPYELIVVENGSHDGSLEYLKTLSTIRLLALPENLGFAGGVNKAFEIAQGDTVCLLNSDAFVTKKWLSKMLSCMKKTKAGLVGPQTNKCKGKQRRKAFKRFIPYWIHPYVEVEFLSFFCILLSKTVIDRVGLLDEKFGFGTFEDDDYCRRARAAGFRLMIDRKAWVWHESHQTFLANHMSEQMMREKNEAYFQEKWGEDCLTQSAEPRN